ncbi:hypothetical protein CRUP_000129 [Coryphaenoides rupestris]|nr:hypothetical protein CRUP_000129 [Coryphaenoides rupestris]
MASRREKQEKQEKQEAGAGAGGGGGGRRRRRRSYGGSGGAELQFSLFGVGVEDFFMDASSGELRIAGPMDRERTPGYALVVQATDGGGLFCRSDVRLRLLDVNDNAPSFSSSAYVTSVPENAAPKTLLTRLQASDPDLAQVSAGDSDSDRNGAVSYQVVADLYNSSLYFRLDGRTGTLVTTRPLDFELARRHDFLIRATDGGDPTLSSQVRVTVSVTDRNDNAPDFSQPLYEAHVSELAPRGHFVACVQASDADACDADRLR